MFTCKTLKEYFTYISIIMSATQERSSSILVKNAEKSRKSYEKHKIEIAKQRIIKRVNEGKRVKTSTLNDNKYNWTDDEKNLIEKSIAALDKKDIDNVVEEIVNEIIKDNMPEAHNSSPPNFNDLTAHASLNKNDVKDFYANLMCNRFTSLGDDGKGTRAFEINPALIDVKGFYANNTWSDYNNKINKFFKALQEVHNSDNLYDFIRNPQPVIEKVKEYHNYKPGYADTVAKISGFISKCQDILPTDEFKRTLFINAKRVFPPNVMTFCEKFATHIPASTMSIIREQTVTAGSQEKTAQIEEKRESMEYYDFECLIHANEHIANTEPDTRQGLQSKLLSELYIRNLPGRDDFGKLIVVDEPPPPMKEKAKKQQNFYDTSSGTIYIRDHKTAACYPEIVKQLTPEAKLLAEKYLATFDTPPKYLIVKDDGTAYCEGRLSKVIVAMFDRTIGIPLTINDIRHSAVTYYHKQYANSAIEEERLARDMGHSMETHCKYLRQSDKVIKWHAMEIGVN